MYSKSPDIFNVSVSSSSHKYQSHANTRTQPLCEQIQIPIRNKTQDALQSNRYIHLIKSDAELDEHIRVPDRTSRINPLNPELNPICYLLALLAHYFLHVSRIRVKSLTIRLLMSYVYMEHLFLMFLDHTQRRSTVGRTPLDE